MSDKFVLVATFYIPAEAQLASGLLETEGIRAFLTGCQAVSVFGVSGPGGQIQLQVAEADAARAAEILAPHFDHQGADGDADAENDARLWLCPLCGDAVNDDLEWCPACDTPRPAGRKSLGVTAAPRQNLTSQRIQEEPAVLSEKVTSDAPLEATAPALASEFEAPDIETLVGDDLVRRAFFSSLFPLLIPYSLWLLRRLAFYPGKISPRMKSKLYWTIAIDAFFGLCLLMLFLILLANVLSAADWF